jgi:hypothetical protein
MMRLLMWRSKTLLGNYFATLEAVGMDELGSEIKKSSINSRKMELLIMFMIQKTN